MTIGERIKQRRKELGISADDLGEKLGVARSTVFRYENGFIEKVPVDVIKTIANALQTTPEYLMGWEEVQKNNDIQTDIVVRMRTDAEFYEVVKRIYELDREKLTSLRQLLQ
jgi:repressor LexA